MKYENRLLVEITAIMKRMSACLAHSNCEEMISLEQQGLELCAALLDQCPEMQDEIAIIEEAMNMRPFVRDILQSELNKTIDQLITLDKDDPSRTELGERGVAMYEALYNE